MNIAKIIEILMSLFAGHAHGLLQQTQGIPKQLVNNVRLLVIILVVTLGSLALFCIGVTIAVTDLIKQLDSSVAFSWTATFTGGVILVGLTLLGMIYCLRERTWMKVAGLEREERSRQEAEQHAPRANPLEEALGLLIADFVHEREMKRQNHENDGSK